MSQKILHILLVNSNDIEQVGLISMLKNSNLKITIHKVALNKDFHTSELASLLFDVLIIDFDALYTDFYNQNDFVNIIPYKVVLSSQRKDVLKAFKFNAFDFFDKSSMSPNELINILFRIQFKIESIDKIKRIDELFRQLELNKKISFIVEDTYYLIKPKSIIYIKSSDNGCLVHLEDYHDFITTEPFHQIKRKLPNSVFVKINDKMILNLTFLSRINLNANTFTISSNGKNEVFPITLEANHSLTD